MIGEKVMATSAGRLFHGMDPFMIYLNSSLACKMLSLEYSQKLILDISVFGKSTPFSLLHISFCLKI